MERDENTDNFIEKNKTNQKQKTKPEHKEQAGKMEHDDRERETGGEGRGEVREERRGERGPDCVMRAPDLQTT